VVHSHISYDSDVAAVCHHSGYYLTQRETNPEPATFLREIHDFPGLNTLDQEFQTAAHSETHHHLIWSPVGIAGSAMVVSGLLLISAILPAIVNRNQTANDIEFVLLYSFLVLSGLAGVTLTVWGALRISHRFTIYHEHARAGHPVPTLADFPLLHCRYQLEANERLFVNLSTAHQYRPRVHAQNCRLKIDVHAQDIAQNRADFQQYRDLYDDRYGTHVYAGLVALEGIHTLTQASRQQFELDHRIPLRAKTPSLLQINTAISTRDLNDAPLITIEKPYTIIGKFINPDYTAGEHFPLVFFARLSDSYTIEMIFQWYRNPGKTTECMLDMFELDIPKELETSIHEVSRGRYAVEQRKLIWQSLRFHQPLEQEIEHSCQELRLQVIFNQPILEYEPFLKGEYRCLINGLISDIQVHPHLIWDARGLNIVQQTAEVRPSVYRQSSIEGDLELDVRPLLQDHEYVVSEQLRNERKPDHTLIHEVLEALTKWEINVQHIEAAEPRFESINDQPRRTYYWDIIGQWHDLVTLNTFDVYVVITSQDQLAQEGGTSIDALCDTVIEIRVRCTHDPRDPTMRHQADKLLGAVAEEVQQLQSPPESREPEAAQPRESTPPEAAVVGKVTVGHLEILLKNAGTHWWLQARNISQTEIQAVTIQATPSQTINSSPRLFEVRRLSSDESSEDMSIALHKVRNEFIEQQKIELSHAIEHVQKRIRVLQRRMGSAEPIQRARHKQDIEDQQEALAEYQEMWDELMQPKKVELQMLVSYKADNTSKVDHDIQTLSFTLEEVPQAE